MELYLSKRPNPVQRLFNGLIFLVFSHMIRYLGGLSILVDAWKLVLAGHPEQVAKFPGHRDDSMAGLYRSDGTEIPKTHGSLLSGWKLTIWTFRAALEGWQSPYEWRLLRVPGKVIDAIVAQTRRDIALETPTSNTNSFVSDNDVILALINHCVA